MMQKGQQSIDLDPVSSSQSSSNPNDKDVDGNISSERSSAQEFLSNLSSISSSKSSSGSNSSSANASKDLHDRANLLEEENSPSTKNEKLLKPSSNLDEKPSQDFFQNDDTVDELEKILNNHLLNLSSSSTTSTPTCNSNFSNSSNSNRHQTFSSKSLDLTSNDSTIDLFNSFIDPRLLLLSEKDHVNSNYYCSKQQKKSSDLLKVSQSNPNPSVSFSKNLSISDNGDKSPKQLDISSKPKKTKGQSGPLKPNKRPRKPQRKKSAKNSAVETVLDIPTMPLLDIEVPKNNGSFSQNTEKIRGNYLNDGDLGNNDPDGSNQAARTSTIEDIKVGNDTENDLFSKFFGELIMSNDSSFQIGSESTSIPVNPNGFFLSKDQKGSGGTLLSHSKVDVHGAGAGGGAASVLAAAAAAAASSSISSSSSPRTSSQRSFEEFQSNNLLELIQQQDQFLRFDSIEETLSSSNMEVLAPSSSSEKTIKFFSDPNINDRFSKNGGDEEEGCFPTRNSSSLPSKEVILPPNFYDSSDRFRSSNRIHWTKSEEDLLIEEVEMFFNRHDCMSQIMKRHGPNGMMSKKFADRTGVSLKDKAINISSRWHRDGTKLSDIRRRAFARFRPKQLKGKPRHQLPGMS